MDVVVAPMTTGLMTPPGCLACGQRMEHGYFYCQACWDQKSRAVYALVTRPGTSSAADVVRRLGLDPNAEPLEIIDPPATRHCAWCGQRHERGSGQCACWSET